VVFTKANGEERVMKCTLNAQYLPVCEESKEEVKPHAKRKLNDAVVSAFDLESRDWRSFKIESIKSITKEPI